MAAKDIRSFGGRSGTCRLDTAAGRGRACSVRRRRKSKALGASNRIDLFASDWWDRRSVRLQREMESERIIDVSELGGW